MQLSEADKLAMNVSKQIRTYFGDKVDNFSIYNVMEKPHIEFSIRFEAYHYFNIILNYDRGSFGCAIINGELGIGLDNSQEWYDTADMDVFFQELQQQIELRIPDKFLEFYGWK